jgi:hypothetical protein
MAQTVSQAAVYAKGFKKNPTITETIRLHRLRWFGHIQRMEENRIPKRVLSMKLETRPTNRWQGKVYDREEWKILLRTARNHRILHMPVE